MSWYKGADWLVKQFDILKDKNTMLVVAGGPSYSLAEKKHYKAITNHSLKWRKVIPRSKSPDLFLKNRLDST